MGGMQIRQCLWTGGFFLSLDVFKGVAKSSTDNKLAQDILSGFMAGVFGTTLDPANKGEGFFQACLNPGPFFGQASTIMAEKGIAGLYSGYGVKCVHLGGSGAILAVLVPRFKDFWGC